MQRINESVRNVFRIIKHNANNCLLILIVFARSTVQNVDNMHFKAEGLSFDSMLRGGMEVKLHCLVSQILAWNDYI